MNREALKQYNVEQAWIKSMLIRDAEQAGWNACCENGIQVRRTPTPIGEIMKGFQIDTFPIADTTMEYCVLHLTQCAYKKKCSK